MRVSTHKILKPILPKFEPFKIVFTIETRKEAEAFHNLFNYAPVCNVIENNSNITGCDIRAVIEKEVKGLGVTNWEEFLVYFRGD